MNDFFVLVAQPFFLGSRAHQRASISVRHKQGVREGLLIPGMYCPTNSIGIARVQYARTNEERYPIGRQTVRTFSVYNGRATQVERTIQKTLVHPDLCLCFPKS